MDKTSLDNVLAKTYEDFNVPVDQFIGDSGLTEEFVTAVQDRAGVAGLDAQAVMRRLVNLRKKGRLPRLRRAYFGRDVSNN